MAKLVIGMEDHGGSQLGEEEDEGGGSNDGWKEVGGER